MASSPGAALIAETTLKTIRDVFATPPPTWNSRPVDATMRDYIRRRAEEPAFVDPHNTRSQLFSAFLRGEASAVIRECPLAHIIYLSESPYPAVAASEVPWDTWGRIFQAFSAHSGATSRENKKWRVIIFGSSKCREFPPEGTLLAPEHINGGSAYRCEPASILIVRKEEMTRVLVHELFHAACSDDMNHDIETVEAHTEAWAEFMLAAIMSRGLQPRFCKLWPYQVAYAEKQAALCHQRGNIRDPKDYGCRYITMRIDAWHKEGLYPTCPLPPPSKVKVNTLRFTSELLDPAIVYAKKDKRKP
jgi:hypothetical protein